MNWQQSDGPGNMTLVLILFIIFIKSLGDGLVWMSPLQVMDGTIHPPSGGCSWHAAGQGLPGRNLNKLLEWVVRNMVRFNKSRGKIPVPGME